MKLNQILILCFTLLTFIFAGCSDVSDDFDPAQKLPAGSIVLELGTEPAMHSRTVLEGSYNLHHVSKVYAVLYRGEGAGASYVWHKSLDWNPQSEAEYGDGVIQRRSFSLEPPALADGAVYTLLCVGLDDKSGESYGLDMSDSSAPDFCADGRKLSDAMAILAEGGDMTESELFAGVSSFGYSVERANEVKVDLSRRVSGVYVYLKDIPSSLYGKEVKYIQLVSGNLLPDRIGLVKKQQEGNLIPEDFGSGVQDDAAKVLDRLQLDAIGKPGVNNLYEIDPQYTEAAGLAPNTLRLSAYLLPMAGGADNTFSVELLDQSGQVIVSFPAVWTQAPDGIDSLRFPVYPNYIYHVGTRDSESDRPTSLAGDRLELVVQPWSVHNIEFDFPNVPIDASIGGYDKNPSRYIYDSMDESDKVLIMPSLMKKDWKLTVVAEDVNGRLDPTTVCDWLYFILPDGSYSQELDSRNYEGYKEQSVEVRIHLNDFVVERDIETDYNPNFPSGREAINNDWRRARIVLKTEESSSDAHLSFRQYNAITVKHQYKNLAIKRDFKCGFSRFDMGVERDSNGEVVTQGTPNGWGFWSSAFYQIYPGYIKDQADNKPCYNGRAAYKEAKENSKGFDNSLIDISHLESVEIKAVDGKYVNTTAENYWYLPSQWELFAFFNDMVRHDGIEAHVEKGALYWSATAELRTRLLEYEVESFCQRTNNIDVEHTERRTLNTITKARNEGYTRRARKFADYNPKEDNLIE